jgi:FixJ family two-component response regulator
VYLRKPVDDQTLLDAIELAIRGASKERIESP